MNLGAPGVERQTTLEGLDAAADFPAAHANYAEIVPDERVVGGDGNGAFQKALGLLEQAETRDLARPSAKIESGARLPLR